MHRTGGVEQVVRGADQRRVREHLWEVADLPLAPVVVFLGQQPDIVAQAGQAREQRPRLVQPSSRPSWSRVCPLAKREGWLNSEMPPPSLQRRIRSFGKSLTWTLAFKAPVPGLPTSGRAD